MFSEENNRSINELLAENFPYPMTVKNSWSIYTDLHEDERQKLISLGVTAYILGEESIKQPWRDDYPAFSRASGECICARCGQPFWRHPANLNYVDWEGHPYLHTLCDGRNVKL